MSLACRVEVILCYLNGSTYMALCRIKGIIHTGDRGSDYHQCCLSEPLKDDLRAAKAFPERHYGIPSFPSVNITDKDDLVPQVFVP